MGTWILSLLLEKSIFRNSFSIEPKNIEIYASIGMFLGSFLIVWPPLFTEWRKTPEDKDKSIT